ncbi:hypothetical protein E4U21_004308, partial [Claviceps maximensis]
QNDKHIRRLTHPPVPPSGGAPPPDGPSRQGDGQRRPNQKVRGEFVQDPKRHCGRAELVPV